MSDFRQLTEAFWASPQITEADVAEASQRGFAMIVNNRPEGESPDQTSGSVIEQASHAAGLDYAAIPITHAGFSDAQVDELIAALRRAGGPVLAYCRSGTRSTLLWALAQAKLGIDPQTISSQANAAGYDVAPIKQSIEQLHLHSRG